MEQNRLNSIVEDILAYLHARVDAGDVDSNTPEVSVSPQRPSSTHRRRHATPPKLPN